MNNQNTRRGNTQIFNYGFYKKEGHCRGGLSGIPIVFNDAQGGDPRQRHSGMTLYKIKARGFTLIELLVVVLIIGILAAIAIPQYQKAVLRARLTEVLTNIDTLKKAVDRAVLEDRDDVWNFLSEGVLDVEIPFVSCEGDYCHTQDWTYSVTNEMIGPYIQVRYGKDLMLEVEGSRPHTSWGIHACYGYTNVGVKMCNLLPDKWEKVDQRPLQN